jgi:hypothetical protein
LLYKNRGGERVSKSVYNRGERVKQTKSEIEIEKKKEKDGDGGNKTFGS